MVSATSSWRNSTRSAEQRWPALSKAERERVVHHLLGQRRGIDDHAVQPAGLGDQLDDRAVARGERPVDGDTGVGAAGEGNAIDAPIADQRGADRSHRVPGRR